MNRKDAQFTPSLPSSCSSGNRPRTPDAGDNTSVTLLPSPPPSSPLRLVKRRKLEALAPTGGHKRRQGVKFLSDQAIVEVRDAESDEEVIIITDSESEG